MNLASEIPAFWITLLLIVVVLWKIRRNLGKQERKCEHSGRNIPEPSGRLPLIGHLHLLRGQSPVFKKLSALSDNLGPFFSLKLGIHRLIVVSDHVAVKQCLATNDRVLATRPKIAVGEYIGYQNAILALAPYGDYWREIRKISTIHLFSDPRLETLHGIRVVEVNAFLKRLYTITLEDPKRAVAIDKIVEFLTFNIVLRTIVGKRVEIGDEESEEWRYKTAIRRAIRLSGVFMLCDAVPWLKWLDFVKVGSMKSTAKELDKCITKWLNEHLENKLRSCDKVDQRSHPKTFMEILLENLPKDVLFGGYSRDTIVKATTLILTLTGSDSTSITLIWAISLLLNNRDVLKTTQEEIDMVVGKDRWVEESDIGKLEYFQAVMKETLRLYPPAPLTGLREAMDDCNINGYHVSKGTRVIVNIHKLHRDPQVWVDPEKFIPERFLTGKPGFEDTEDRTGFEYIPFSAGRRSCPGFNFGLRVVHLALARLLQGFDMETITGKPVDMTEGSGLAMPKVMPVEVTVLPRLKPDLYHCL